MVDDTKAKSDLSKLVEVGTQLFGQDWQTPMSKALGVSDRLVRKWVAKNVSKRTPVPEWVIEDLPNVVAKRIQVLEEDIERIRAYSRTNISCISEE